MIKASLPTTGRFEIDGSAHHFTGYAATKDTQNRKSISKNLVSVDTDLTPKDRDKAITRGREHQKDFSIAGWMARKHLDFIAEQSLTIRTGDKSLDKDIESALSDRSRPENFDIRGNHSRESYTRLVELLALVDGDVFTQKLVSGHVQGFEADRVRTPSASPKNQKWVHGCEVDRAGKIRRVAVCERGDRKNDLQPQAVLKYSTVLHHGYFQRLDQVRGASPFLPAMNNLQDVYENKAYALAKAKIGQLFGMALFRGTNDGEGETPDPTKGPMILELERDDKAQFLSDNNPSNTWQDFMQTVISMALKSLDIPFSFYQEDFTNFFGSKSALLLYLKSCVSKRRNLRQRFLEPWTEWQLNLLKADPEFRVLRGLEKVGFRWIAQGTPWANPLQEVQASVMEISMGMSSRKRKVMEIYGEDVYDIIDEIQEEQAYMEAAGLDVARPSTLLINEVKDNVDE